MWHRVGNPEDRFFHNEAQFLSHVHRSITPSNPTFVEKKLGFTGETLFFYFFLIFIFLFFFFFFWGGGVVGFLTQDIVK